MAGLANSFGRGAMTNHWIDYKNSDVIMAIGGNTAENHPISMKWINRAREERGAKLIVVDPRFTRTAAVADIYCPIRPGTDIAFIGGLINYAIQNNLYHEEYIKNYTNASSLIVEGFGFEDGMFTGFADGAYDKSTWEYQRDGDGNIIKDETLQDPNCVWQLFKKHYERYDVDTVCDIVGCSKEQFLKVAETFCATGAPDKAGNILYAMGVTQHTYGSQNVRSIAILQLLLGNMGRPGGGVNAQRGESNVQGSTDMCVLFHILPGYLGYPQAAAHPTLSDYIEKETPSSGYWSNKPKFLISLLKAWWGEHATADNDFCYDYLPKLDGKNRSHVAMFEYMDQGEIKGLFAWGQNPAVGGADSTLERRALEKLDWLVVVDIFETETAAFWKRPGVNPAEIDTEVFLLPAAGPYEKEESLANSGRWIQWRYKAVNPPGDAKSDSWIANKLFLTIRELYEAEGGAFPDPILNLNWDYGDDEYDMEKICGEINGYYTADGSLVENFTALADDGSTACGNWLYSGYYNDYDNPPCKRRIKETEGIGTNLEWAFSWPLNRRIIYNRCSSDANGNPWDDERKLIWWENGEWQKLDVPDFNANVPPEETADKAFIMLPELQARFFAAGMADGPFPEHYEPVESPVSNKMSGAQYNPAIKFWPSAPDITHYASVGDPDFPYIASTYRVCEHWQSGIMTRNCPWLNELMPNMFVEISTKLAGEKGIENGDKVVIETKRGEIEAIACVTERIKPLNVNGKEIEIVGMPWHWGYQGFSTGDSANTLTPHIGDANTTIPEYKAFLCNIRRAG